MAETWPTIANFEDERDQKPRNVVTFRSWELLPAIIQQGKKDLSPTTTWNWILPSTWVSLEVDFFSEPPVRSTPLLIPWCQAVWVSQQFSAQPSGFLDYRTARWDICVGLRHSNLRQNSFVMAGIGNCFRYQKTPYNCQAAWMAQKRFWLLPFVFLDPWNSVK